MKDRTSFQISFDQAEGRSFNKITLANLEDFVAKKKTWIHVTAPSNIVKNKLKKLYHAPAFVWDSIFAESTRPRSSAVADGVMLILRGINYHPGSEPDEMVSLRLWVTQDYLISVSMKKVSALADACKYISEQPQEVETPMDCFLLLIDYVFDRIGEAIYALETRLDDLEENLDTLSEDIVQQTIVTTRQEIIGYRRYLLPQRDAVLRISLDKLSWVSKLQDVYMSDLAENMSRYADDISTVRERAAVLQDSVASKLTERVNNKIYVLTVVTLIFLPPMLITGVFGMNIVVPGQQSPFTFWIVSTIMTVLTGGLFIYFKHNKWF